MSADSAPSLTSSGIPIVHRSELQDIRLLSVEGHSPDRPLERADISVAVDDISYRIEPRLVFVRLATVVRYFEAREDNQSLSSDPLGDAADLPELGRLTVVHVAELSLDGDPNDITPDQVQDFLGNMLFIMFPFVRASISRYSVDLSLPPTWLPYLQRSLHDPGAGASESGNGLADDPEHRG